MNLSSNLVASRVINYYFIALIGLDFVVRGPDGPDVQGSFRRLRDKINEKIGSKMQPGFW